MPVRAGGKILPRKNNHQFSGKPQRAIAAGLPLTDLRWSLIVTACFLLVGLLGVIRHEMWRDEYQAWMIGNNSSSLLDLVRVSRFDGHPATWFSVLYLISGLTPNPVWMQIVHLGIAASTVFLFNRFCPIDRLSKLLFSFGYFPLYEYALISREYAIGFLCVAAICGMYPRRRELEIQISFVLFLLSITSVYGLVLALSLAAALALDRVSTAADATGGARARGRLALGIIIFISGPILLWFQLRPHEEHYFPLQWATGFDWHRFKITLTFMLRSYMPVPNPTGVDFWNSHLLLDGFSDSRPVVSLMILFITACLFARKTCVLVLYFTGTLGLLTLGYMTGLPWLRHIGHLYIVLIACTWIAHYYTPPERSWIPVHRIPILRSERFGHLWLTLLLSANLVAGLYACQMDLRHPFSNSLAASQYLREERLDGLPIVGSTDYVVSPLSALLRKPIFYPERGEEGTFILWDKRRRDVSGLADIGQAVDSVLRGGHEKVLLVLQSGIVFADGGREVLATAGRLEPNIQVKLLRKFDGDTIVGDEKYFIYLARRTVR